MAAGAAHGLGAITKPGGGRGDDGEERVRLVPHRIAWHLQINPDSAADTGSLGLVIELLPLDKQAAKRCSLKEEICGEEARELCIPFHSLETYPCMLLC